MLFQLTWFLKKSRRTLFTASLSLHSTSTKKSNIFYLKYVLTGFQLYNTLRFLTYIALTFKVNGPVLAVLFKLSWFDTSPMKFSKRKVWNLHFSDMRIILGFIFCPQHVDIPFSLPYSQVHVDSLLRRKRKIMTNNPDLHKESTLWKELVLQPSGRRPFEQRHLYAFDSLFNSF